MIRQIGIGQQVTYVAPPKEEGGKVTTKKATVIEVFGRTEARLDLSGDGKHTAIASYSEDKSVPNTFHFTDADAKAAPAQPSSTNGS